MDTLSRTQKGENMSDAKKQKKDSSGRKNEKSFTFTAEALKVIAAAKAKGLKSGKFVSDCIVAQGQLILDDQYPVSGKPSLDARLEYLEKTLTNIAYNAITQRLDADSLSEHEKMLDKFSLRHWYDNLDALHSLAAANEKTKDTKTYEWQTLIRKREYAASKKNKK
jgi:hypothetical protein